MNISSHGGHNSIIQGANSVGRKEHLMDRELNSLFIKKLRQLGHSVEDDTDEVGRSADAIVGNQIRNINDRYNDVGFAWHLNASNGEGHGVEVLCYSANEVPMAGRISAEIAKRTGWKNRGAKVRPDVGVVRASNCKFFLIEAGFIDNESDMAKWNPNAIVDAVIYAYFGQSLISKGEESNMVKTAAIHSGGIILSEVPGAVNKMREFGITGQVIVQSDGYYSIKTDRIDEQKIWKLDNWFQSKNWAFSYI